MSLILHHAHWSRSERILWLLEEIGAPYSINRVSIRRRDGSGGPDAANPHPLKQAPALTHNGVTIVESTVIMAYLCDAFPEAGLAPRMGEPTRARYMAWLGLYAGVVEPIFAARASNADGLTREQAFAYDEIIERWRAALERGAFLMGDRFSVIDILYGGTLFWRRDALPEGDPYDSYVKRLTERPARLRALARDQAETEPAAQ
jgi:glutathione S-transferase